MRFEPWARGLRWGLRSALLTHWGPAGCGEWGVPGPACPGFGPGTSVRLPVTEAPRAFVWRVVAIALTALEVITDPFLKCYF